jgi:hypothetical protein
LSTNHHHTSVKMQPLHPSLPATPTTLSMNPPFLPASASNPQKTLKRPIIPRPQKLGRNGFTDRVSYELSDMAKRNLFLDNQRFAEFVLQHRGSGISTEDMEKEIQETSTVNKEMEHNKKLVIEHTEALIAKLREEHLHQLASLYDMHAQDYRDEREHQYYTRLASHITSTNVGPADTISDVNELYSRANCVRPAEWDDNYSRLRYAQLKELQPLQHKIAKLRESERSHRIQRGQKFPQSVEEYQSIDAKDVRLRIARFLQVFHAGSASAVEREKMMDTFQWSYLQVGPLTDAYKKDGEFRNLVTAETKTIESKDPRRRSSLNVAS